MGTTFEETIGSRHGLQLHVIIETSTDGGTIWEETDWDEAVLEYGPIEQAIEDWTGLFSVGELELKLADPDNTIFGSFTH